jgi:hypothetical protein
VWRREEQFGPRVASSTPEREHGDAMKIKTKLKGGRLLNCGRPSDRDCA